MYLDLKNERWRNIYDHIFAHELQLLIVMSGRFINFRPEACARTKSGHGLAHACSCSLGIEFLCWVDCSLKLMTKTSGISGCLTEESCSMSCKDCTGLMPVLRKLFHSKKNHCVTRVCYCCICTSIFKCFTINFFLNFVHFHVF